MGGGKGWEEGLQNPNFETVPKTGKKVKGTREKIEERTVQKMG